MSPPALLVEGQTGMFQGQLPIDVAVKRLFEIGQPLAELINPV